MANLKEKMKVYGQVPVMEGEGRELEVFSRHPVDITNNQFTGLKITSVSNDLVQVRKLIFSLRTAY